MASKISNSWELVKASANVLNKDKELVIFPILSTIGVIIVTATFLLPMFFSGLIESVAEGMGGEVISFIVLFLFYIVQYFVIFFMNSALVGAALIRIRGGDPTVRDGFKIAFGKFFPILGYAVIAATVGMILKTIQEKSKGLGRAVIGLIGFAWNVATFLVVPILVTEGVGPFKSIKRSVQYLKKTWGEQIVGNFGLGAFFGLIVLGLFLIAIPVFYLAISSETLWLIITLAVIFLLAFVMVGLIQSTLNGIYTAAVYQYASTGEVTNFFKPEMVQEAFQPTNPIKYQ
jgi:hypothetical protein